MKNWITQILKGKLNNQQRKYIEPTTELNTSHQSLETPYIAARREWNERYGSYIARARTWQLVALALIGLCAVLSLSLARIASQAKVQPFIVEVDKLGEAVAIKAADTANIPDQRIIRFQLANFITNARSITPDPIVQKRWLDSIYAISTSSAATFLNDYYKKNDPFNIARTSLVSVDIQSALPLSQSTWQVQWTETRRDLNGRTDSLTRWQAVLNIAIYPPSTQQEIIANPTGVVIDQINWTQHL